MVTKALLISKVFCPGYSFLFFFDNTTSHSVYAKDMLQVKDLNKNIRGKQLQLRNRWYNLDGVHTVQAIIFQYDGRK